MRALCDDLYQYEAERHTIFCFSCKICHPKLPSNFQSQKIFAANGIYPKIQAVSRKTILKTKEPA